MEQRIRVYNDRKYDIGLLLQNGMERVVKPGSYTLLSREEIEHLAAIAPGMFFGENQLRLENRALAVELGFILDESVPVFGPDLIRKHLSGSAAKLKQWLDGITDPPLLEEVYEVARGMDLPASKLQVLQDRLPGKTLIEPKEG